MTGSQILETCPKCGKRFECCHSSQNTCWCKSVKVNKETLSSIAMRYDRCLCPDCLNLFAPDTLQQNESLGISVIFVPGISVKMCQSERWCNSTKKCYSLAKMPFLNEGPFRSIR
ncbi:cysteine-rich CWC family protein [Alkaliflexus imshenetskii]|uniref:cysteine-rich CWC family protein n=1 Tax=Alkaliflexus imshenetskii TaxID=286730 RepID=UPI0009FE921C